MKRLADELDHLLSSLEIVLGRVDNLTPPRTLTHCPDPSPIHKIRTNNYNSSTTLQLLNLRNSLTAVLSESQNAELKVTNVPTKHHKAQNNGLTSVTQKLKQALFDMENIILSNEKE